jgi:hypothetical protein
MLHEEVVAFGIIVRRCYVDGLEGNMSKVKDGGVGTN